MVEPIENEYFNWLCAKVVSRFDNNDYYDLLKILHTTEFVWVVPGDRHRIDEAFELRKEFIKETKIKKNLNWELLPCSVLELLISFAQRTSFQTDESVEKWFWEFIVNLHLEEFTYIDDNNIRQIEDILYIFIWRQYEPNGSGGLFPVGKTKNDQRKVELWYQFSEYVEDRGII